jgi:hypothetical protein
MKTWKLLVSVLVIAFVVCSNVVNAQSYRHVLTMTCDKMYFGCLDRTISGTWMCNFTYHLDKKTGVIDQMHWNTLHSNLYDIETGEKLICLDTGSDNLGTMFLFFNNPNYYNGIDCYDVEDGWLNPVMPSSLPEEGTYIEMNWKFIIGGEVYKLAYMVQLHKNANGEVKVDNSKAIMNCIE